MTDTTTTHAPYSERVFRPVPGAEQERRWTALRRSMEADGIDVLLFHNQTENLGGYVRWISDFSHDGGYPLSVVFPRDDDMTVVMHGPIGTERELDPRADPYLRGIRRILHTASFISASYTTEYDAELVSRALQAYGKGRIGVVGPGHIPSPMADLLRKHYPAATFVDYSSQVDLIKSVKSDWEIEAIKRTATMQDEAFAALLTEIRPGVREVDLHAFASAFCERAGSDAGLVMLGASTQGDPHGIAPRRLMNRELREGDSFVVLIERNGPEGYFVEIGRTVTLGPAPQGMVEEYEFAASAQDFAASLLKPGALSGEIFDAYNEFLAENGRPREQRLFCHGQGYDIVERPLVRHDETMTIAGRMNIAVHPGYVTDGRAYWLCDNWVLDENGTGTRIHETERKIFECG